MTDASDFLAAIIERPDDDLPRLVFADYLEERGEPERAEFIRVQCELARLSLDHEDRPHLATRETELLDAHRPLWVIPDLQGPQRFRRGFVEEVETAAEWLLAADRPLDRAPIRDLSIVNVDKYLDALIRVPGLNRVETLNLRANSLGADGRLERLFTEGRFDRLTHLNLQNNRLWPESLEPFTRTPVAAQLTTLHLSGNPLSDEGAEIIARTRAFKNLRELIFRSDEQSWDDSLHPLGAECLVSYPGLRKLRVLNLAGHWLRDSGLMFLVNSRLAEGLEELDVSYNHIGEVRAPGEVGRGDRGIEALVASSRLGNLRRLNLAGNELDELAVRALLRWPRLREGVRVDLTDIDLSAVERAMIAQSEFAGQLQVSPPEQE